jgi:hypothetical protein
MERSLRFKTLLFVHIFAVAFFSGGTSAIAQVDEDATEKTKILYSNLKKIQEGNTFLFGQEFFNSFRFNSGGAHGDETFSDSKDVTGSHPAVLGSDFHYYLEKSATERGYHTDAVKWAYQQGYVITFDWHISARGTTSYEYAGSPPNLVSNIVNNLNGDRAWLYGELDKIISIINTELVVDGDTIPIVFRPWHEMNGGWFWWGSNGATAANYKALYQLTVDYMTERTRSVLFCWSPNTPFGLDRYPGDEYVDVVGVDAYEVNVNSLRTEVGKVVDYAQAHDKVAVFSETGDRNANENSGVYWKNVILPGIMDDPSGKSKKIAWVLTWINASWSEPYVPHSGSSQTVKQSFIDFKNSPAVLFGDEIEDMYVPITDPEPEVPVATEEGTQNFSDDLHIYIAPDSNTITVRLRGFEKPSTIRVYDLAGSLVNETNTSADETRMIIKSSLKPGVYMFRVSDRKKTATKKIAISRTIPAGN